MAERVIISGDAGTTWQNDTGKARYQFVAAPINTCGTCLQYHLKIGINWPIPIHYNCRCHQILIPPGESAPHSFCDYRELLDKMSEADQAAAIGASNYRLLKSGLASWEDIVTKNRVRDFREVVARKKLTVAEMVKHGVKKYQAEKAYASVHTSEHELVEQKRRELFQKITEAGVPHDKLVAELSKRLAGRVTIAPGPTAAGRTAAGSARARMVGRQAARHGAVGGGRAREAHQRMEAAEAAAETEIGSPGGASSNGGARDPRRGSTGEVRRDANRPRSAERGNRQFPRGASAGEADRNSDRRTPAREGARPPGELDPIWQRTGSGQAAGNPWSRQTTAADRSFLRIG